jgi:hypothetical protein
MPVASFQSYGMWWVSEYGYICWVISGNTHLAVFASTIILTDFGDLDDILRGFAIWDGKKERLLDLDSSCIKGTMRTR